MGDVGETASGKLTLYTNHGCPWAHRAHIALHELGLQYDEVIIDLEKPREEWYLEINDRGLVPTLQHTNEAFGSSEPVTIIESALVVQYLIDAFPHRSSHILPAAKDPKSAYDRYRINLLVDTWFSKVGPLWFKALLMTGTDEATTKADEVFEAIKKHIEPLLATALREGPFMGGSQRLTLGEANRIKILTGPFVLRIHDFSNSDGAVHPQSLAEKLDTLPAYSKWSKAVASHESVTRIWRKEDMIKTTQRRAPDMRKKYGVAK